MTTLARFDGCKPPSNAQIQLLMSFETGNWARVADPESRPRGDYFVTSRTVAAKTTNPSGSERRRFPRVNIALAVRVRFASAEAAMLSQTVDISEGGVFIRTPQIRPEGTAIRLNLQIGERSLAIGGVVVRCVRPGGREPVGIGVLFTELSPEDREYIAKLVEAKIER